MDDSENFDPLKAFCFSEADVSAQLGVATQSVPLYRHHLTEGVHWAKKKRRACWTLEGLRIVAAALGLPAQEVPALARAEVAPAAVTVPEPALRTFKVCQRRPTNPFILLVTDGRDIFRVRVKHRENFRKGMEVKCHHVSADLYTLAGNCPRFPGKY